MWKWTGAIVVVASILIMQACAPSNSSESGEDAFVQNSYGEVVAWKTDKLITIYIHESFPDEFVGAIQSAAATWEKAAGKALFQIIPEKLTGPAEPQKDGKNVIYFMNTWDEARSKEQGRTSVYWTGDRITEADIRINALNFKFYWHGDKSSDRVNIEALVLHEMGHVLGLKHKDAGNSVMATYLPCGADRTHLAAIDFRNLKRKY